MNWLLLRVTIIEHVIGTTQGLREHFKHILNAEFQDTLNLVNGPNGRVLVYPSSLDLDRAVLKFYAVKQNLETLEKHTDESTITKAALILHQLITSRNVRDEWPPDIKTTNIPESLARFYRVILKGEPECTVITERTLRLTNSFSQD